MTKGRGSVTGRSAGHLKKGLLERLWDRYDGAVARLVYGRKRGSKPGSGPRAVRPPRSGNHRLTRLLHRHLGWTYYLHLPGLYWLLLTFSRYYVNYPWITALGVVANMASTWLTVVYLKLELEERGRLPRVGSRWVARLVTLASVAFGLVVFLAFWTLTGVPLT